MQLSHEAINQSLYVQGRDELCRELARCLRYGRTTRQSQRRVKKYGPVANMINISERPIEVEDCAVSGHWEGEFIIGAGGLSAVGTLVEGTARFLLLLHRPRVCYFERARSRGCPGGGDVEETWVSTPQSW